MDYVTVTGAAEHTELIKGSRFIAMVEPVESEADALALLATARQLHPDATHHCSAWRIGQTVRFSDDGEPGGTAGRPMLEVILRRDLQNVAVVVVRYFGGTRLGAGGLVRAYSGAVAKVLDAAGTMQMLEQAGVRATVPFALVDSVLRFLQEEDSVRTLESEYTADGLSLALEMPAGQLGEFTERLRDHTRNEVKLSS